MCCDSVGTIARLVRFHGVRMDLDDTPAKGERERESYTGR